MNATTILNKLETALCFAIAICDIILILLFGDWEGEMTAAKQRLASKAIAQNEPEPETAATPETIAPTEIEPQPETTEVIPNPWELPIESTPQPQPLQPKTRHLTLCLPPAKETTEPQPAKKPRTAKTAKTTKKPTTTKATKAKTAKKAA